MGRGGEGCMDNNCTLKLTSEIGPVASAMPTPSSYDGTADAATTAATPAHMTIDALMIIPQLERGGLVADPRSFCHTACAESCMSTL